MDSVKIAQRSEKDLFQFLSSFDICPTTIGKGKVYSIWTQITQKSISGQVPIYWETSLQATDGGASEGKIFTFGFFLDFIVLVVLEGYCEEGTRKLTPAEGLCFLLERMELSKGYVEF